MTYRTFSSEETRAVGARIAKTLGSRRRILALRGDLGAGKTTFTQGLLAALGARGRVTSPTFVLMKRFPLRRSAARQASRGKIATFTEAYHIDAYRFRAANAAKAGAAKESAVLGLKDIFKNKRSLVLIEWPERLRGVVPRAGRVNVRFAHGKKEHERVIVVS